MVKERKGDGLMQTEYQYIIFIPVKNTGRKTLKFECRNKRSRAVLGIVKWNVAWRQYCYYCTDNTVYSVGCMNDIANFIGQLKEAPSGEKERCSLGNVDYNDCPKDCRTCHNAIVNQNQKGVVGYHGT
jgi:hypothetical protein